MKNKLYNIQYLRGFAAFMVFGTHTNGWLNNSESNIGVSIFGRGAYGVEIFFMISGFIMVYATSKTIPENRIKQAYEFMVKRLIRIFPLYFILTIISIFVWYDYNFFFQWSKFATFLKSIFFIPYSKFPILATGWSLNNEIFFYFLFGISLLFGKIRYYALLSFFAIMIFLQNCNFENPILQMVANHYNNYFLFGVLLGLSIGKIKISAETANIIFVISLVSLFAFFLLPIPKNVFYEYTLAIVSVTGFVIFDLFGKVRFNPFLFTMGNISYSFYLLHLIVNKILMQYFSYIQNFELRSLIFIVLIISTFYLSKLFYKKVEIDLSNYLKNKLIKS